MKKSLLLLFLALFSVGAQAALHAPDSLKKPPLGEKQQAPGALSPGNAVAKKQASDSAGSSGQKKTVKVQVVEVYNKEHPDIKDPEHSKAKLGDEIVIHVKGISDLLSRAAAQHKDIKLFLDSRQVDEIRPASGAPDNDEQDFQFILQRTPANDKVWSGLLGKPERGTFFVRPVKVSVGLDGGVAETSDVTGFQLVRIRHTWFVCCLLGLIAYLLALFFLGRNTAMFRDGTQDLSSIGLTKIEPVRAPYSMGKIQMAFWFSLMLAAFLFIWLITDNYDIITPGVLTLIGISASTALGAVAIGDSKNQSVINDITALQQQRSALQAVAPPPADLQQQLKKIDDGIAAKEKSLRLTSNDLFDDILTDENGVAFHRLQMLVWTLVLGLLFIYSSWNSLIMPDFSATLLTLQGITAGTYLGFKLPEKQT